MIALLGWAGTLATFAAYVLISRGLLHSASPRYIWMNIVGGVLGATASTLYGAWPSVASNVLWAVIGVHTLVSRNASSRSAPVAEMDEHPECASVPAVDNEVVTWRTPAAAA
jgi:hypothetical protein